MTTQQREPFVIGFFMLWIVAIPWFLFRVTSKEKAMVSNMVLSDYFTNEEIGSFKFYIKQDIAQSYDALVCEDASRAIEKLFSIDQAPTLFKLFV